MGGGTRPRGSDPHNVLPPLSSSVRSTSSFAQEVLARDIANCSDDDLDSDIDHGYPIGDHRHPLAYRRASGVAYGGARPVLNPQIADEPGTSALERRRSRDAERSLLRDNHILPPKHGYKEHKSTFFSRAYRRMFSTKLPTDEESPAIVVRGPPDERSPLLRNGASSPTTSDEVDQEWEAALAGGRIRTTWQRETKTLVQYSAPLIVTFLLQYSINVASIIAVGRIGKMELGAVTLANMTAAITCSAPFQGLATSLDTLCSQAYGSGHKHLVGLQLQRMTYFLLGLCVPVSIIWFFAEDILRPMVPDPESARLAGIYLRYLTFSLPGFVLFEGGKRFTQAQGLFRATTYVLLVAAPINMIVNYLLVWKFDLGFVGAPIAVAITQNLLPVLLLCYVYFVDGIQCWGGFSKKAFTNWGIMIRLALPGMIMVEAEWLAFEILTLLASRFGPEYLAAQSVATTLASISYQIPFPVSIAASTRIANLIGAGLVEPARIAAKVTFVMCAIVSVTNLILYSTLRFHLPLLFTDDTEVIALVAKLLPIVAFMQLFDGFTAGAHGLLRGVGKQSIGGPINLFCYYVVSIPASIGLGFGLGLGLEGLWLGVTIGLFLVSVIEYTYLYFTSWEKAALEAQARNEAG